MKTPDFYAIEYNSSSEPIQPNRPAVILTLRFIYHSTLRDQMYKAMDLRPADVCPAREGNVVYRFHLDNKDVGEKYAKRLRKIGLTDVTVRRTNEAQ